MYAYTWDRKTDTLTPTDVPDWKTERHIGNTHVRTLFGTLRVSTVFLVFDHSWNDGQPVLFETMIFGGPWEEWQTRYHTAAEARQGHQAAVRMAKQARWRIDWWLRYYWQQTHRTWDA